MTALELHLTDTCNLHCVHCYAGYSPQNKTFLSLKNTVKALEDFKKLGDSLSEYSTIALSGGEPLLHPDITFIIDYCARNFENTTILTNGRVLSDDLVNSFADYGNIDVQLSLEGNAHIHDKIRGNGTYHEVLSRMESLRNQNIDCRCAMTVHKVNLPYMGDFLSTCHEFEVYPTFHRYIPLGEGKSVMELTPDDGLKFYAYLSSLNHTFNILPHCNLCSFITSGGLSPQHHPCYIGSMCLVIDHHGSIVPCPYLGNPIAHIADSDLSDIYYSSDILRKFRERDYGEICRTCSYAHQCGGCRALSYAYTGDMFADEPLCPLVIKESEKVKNKNRFTDYLKKSPIRKFWKRL